MTNWWKSFRTFVREFQDIHEHARTGRRPERREQGRQTAGRR